MGVVKDHRTLIAGHLSLLEPLNFLSEHMGVQEPSPMSTSTPGIPLAAIRLRTLRDSAAEPEAEPEAEAAPAQVLLMLSHLASVSRMVECSLVGLSSCP